MLAVSTALTIALAVAHHERDSARNRFRQLQNYFDGYREKMKEGLGMSDQAQQVPLIELARSVPKTLHGEWEIQWAEDGTPTGHSLAPVGRYLHELADRIESLEAENKAISRDAALQIAGLQAEIDEYEAENAALREAQRWVPVTERLPDYDEYVLWLMTEGPGEGHCFIECIDKDGVFADMMPHGTSHWMPLPPPSDEQK